ncbi:hypothetical protein Tco_1577661 [Tanacetum coccineum]
MRTQTLLDLVLGGNPTVEIFKIVGLRWKPTRKMFTDNTTKVDSEPSNGSNDVITNSYECDQTLNVSACLALQRQMASVDNTSGPVPVKENKSYASVLLYLSEEREITVLTILINMTHACSMLVLLSSGSTVPCLYRISACRYLLQTLGQEKLEFLMKKVGMQSMSPETMKKLADATEELWLYLLHVS